MPSENNFSEEALSQEVGTERPPERAVLGEGWASAAVCEGQPVSWAQAENWQEAEFAGFQRLPCFSRTEQVGDTVSFTKEGSFGEQSRLQRAWADFHLNPGLLTQCCPAREQLQSDTHEAELRPSES